MNSEQGYLNKSLAEQNIEWRMKQSNSVSINITVTYIVKEHRHILLYFYTLHLAHICFCYILHYLIYNHYLDMHSTCIAQ